MSAVGSLHLRSNEEHASRLGEDAASLQDASTVALLKAIGTGAYAVGLFDPDDRLTYSNKAFREAWSIVDDRSATFDSMIRHCFETRTGAVIETDNVETWLASARHKRRSGNADRSFEVDLWDGRWMWLTERRLKSGWVLCLAQDITALKSSERTLRLARDLAVQASMTDPLTGLANRRAAMQFLDFQTGGKHTFNAAIADVDHFKLINDRYGHQAGDDALLQLSSELHVLEGRGYFVARFAGDEFLIVSSMDETAARFELEMRAVLNRRVEQCAACEASKIFAVSIGAAQFPADGSTVRELLIAADQAMYRAKAQGRCNLQFAGERQ